MLDKNEAHGHVAQARGARACCSTRHKVLHKAILLDAQDSRHKSMLFKNEARHVAQGHLARWPCCSRTRHKATLSLSVNACKANHVFRELNFGDAILGEVLHILADESFNLQQGVGFLTRGEIFQVAISLLRSWRSLCSRSRAVHLQS